jgi:hypothetical protein
MQERMQAIMVSVVEASRTKNLLRQGKVSSTYQCNFSARKFRSEVPGLMFRRPLSKFLMMQQA